MFGVLAFASSIAAADSGALTIKSARVGIGGKCKAGYWTPVWLTVQAGPSGAHGQLELVIPDGDQVPAAYSGGSPAAIGLAAGQEASILLYAKLGPVAAPISVRLRDDERIVWSQPLPGVSPRLLSSQHLMVSVGPSIGLADAVATIKGGPAESSYVAVHVPRPADLPDQWWGYEGVDVVVLATSDAALLDARLASQRQALSTWVRLGGRLILSVGSRGEEFFAGADEWLRPPFQLQEVSPLRDRAGLEAFGAAELPWDDEDFQRNRPQVTRIADLDGIVVIDEGGIASGRPLITRSAYGFGELIFVGIDLDHPGLAQWKGRPRLLANLLQGERGRGESSEGAAGRSVVHLGYDDLVGQLRSALDQFPGVTLVSFTTVATLTVIFLLLVGPGDYLLLTRLNLPRHLTWLTFSAVAALFGVLAWLLGADAHGDRVRLNQVEVIDVDAQQGIVRGTVWAHVYSPAAEQFDLELSVTTDRGGGNLAPGGWLTWQGLPGDALGGLNSRQVVLATADPYAILPPGTKPAITGLPLQTASSKSLAARWWGSGPVIAANLSKNQYGLLAGEITNPLPVELTDWLIAHEDRMYRLDPKRPVPLAPGQAVQIGDLPTLNLEARLTDRIVVDSKDISTQWNQASHDIPQIVRMMLFHEGGPRLGVHRPVAPLPGVSRPDRPPARGAGGARRPLGHADFAPETFEPATCRPAAGRYRR